MSNTTTVTSALLPTSTIIPPQNGTALSTSSSSFGGGIITAFVIAGIFGVIYIWVTIFAYREVCRQEDSLSAKFGILPIVALWPIYVPPMLIHEWWKKGGAGKVKAGVERMIRRMAGLVLGWLERMRKEELKRIEEGDEKEGQIAQRSLSKEERAGNQDGVTDAREGTNVPTEGSGVAKEAC